jgi:YT521-B-like domain
VEWVWYLVSRPFIANIMIRRFSVRWITNTTVPFVRMCHIPIKSSSPPDKSENVTLARDGREISNNAGLRMLQLFEEEAELGPDIPTTKTKQISDWSLSVAPSAPAELQVDLALRVSARSNVHSASFSPDGRFFAVAGNETEIFDLGTGRKVLVLEDKSLLRYENVTIHTSAFSADSTHLATAGQDMQIQVRHFQSHLEPVGFIQNADFCPDMESP